MNENITPCRPKFALNSKSRSVLILLGFKGVWDFAKIADVNHASAGEVLGTCVGRYKSRGHNIAKVHQTLHAAYLRQRAAKVLTPGDVAFILDWHTQWKEWIVHDQLAVTSVGRFKNPDKCEARRTEKKHAATRHEMRNILEALAWEA